LFLLVCNPHTFTRKGLNFISNSIVIPLVLYK
jgi:hypothetical protein